MKTYILSSAIVIATLLSTLPSYAMMSGGSDNSLTSTPSTSAAAARKDIPSDEIVKLKLGIGIDEFTKRTFSSNVKKFDLEIYDIKNGGDNFSQSRGGKAITHIAQEYRRGHLPNLRTIHIDNDWNFFMEPRLSPRGTHTYVSPDHRPQIKDLVLSLFGPKTKVTFPTTFTFLIEVSDKKSSGI